MDGCIMVGPLSVTFSGIYLVKMETDAAIPSKPTFYRRFADDVYSRRNLGDTALFDRITNYHSNIELTMEVSLVSFYTPNRPTSMAPLNSVFIGNSFTMDSKTPKHYKRNTINGDLHHSKNWKNIKKILKKYYPNARTKGDGCRLKAHVHVQERRGI